MAEVGTWDWVTFKASSLHRQAPGVLDLPWPRPVSCCHVEWWRVLSPGKQSSGPPGAAGSCGALSRLDTTKTRKHNETDWLAAGWLGGQPRPRPTAHSAPSTRLGQAGRAGRGLTQDRGHRGAGSGAAGRARWPWDLGFGLMVLLCVLGTGPASPAANPQQTFSYRQSVDPSYERWNVRNVIMFLINR